MDRALISRIKIGNDQLDFNSVITFNGYKLINAYPSNQFVRRTTKCSGEYSRRLFTADVHLLKNSVCRLSDLLGARFKVVEVTNSKRWSHSNEKWEGESKLRIYIPKSKADKQRDVVCRRMPLPIFFSSSISNALELQEIITHSLSRLIHSSSEIPRNIPIRRFPAEVSMSIGMKQGRVLALK